MDKALEREIAIHDGICIFNDLIRLAEEMGSHEEYVRLVESRDNLVKSLVEIDTEELTRVTI